MRLSILFVLIWQICRLFITSYPNVSLCSVVSIHPLLSHGIRQTFNFFKIFLQLTHLVV